MKISTLLLSSLVIFASGYSGTAAAQRKLTFISKYDKFELNLSGGRGDVNGQPANLSTIKDLLPLLTKPLGETCPAFKKPPEITVKEGEKTRTVYVEEGVISDGKGCAMVGGDGLFYFPVHRDFLIGAKSDSIKLKSPVKIFVQGKKVLDMKKQGDTWITESPDMLINWDFIAELEDSLNQFDIRLRVQAGIAKDKPKMIIDNGGQQLEFSKVTNVMWALKKPGTAWLTASDEWSRWGEFDAVKLEDRFAEEIRRMNAAKDIAEKKAVLDKVEGSWTRNLRDMYIRIATNESEDENLRFSALKRLKSKPSKEVAGAMVKILEGSTNDDIRDEAGVILKLNHPKGPKFKSSDSPDDRQKALDFWRNWWQKNKGP